MDGYSSNNTFQSGFRQCFNCPNGNCSRMGGSGPSSGCPGGNCCPGGFCMRGRPVKQPSWHTSNGRQQ